MVAMPGTVLLHTEPPRGYEERRGQPPGTRSSCSRLARSPWARSWSGVAEAEAAAKGMRAPWEKVGPVELLWGRGKGTD